MTVFCPSCGKPNADEAESCVSCGASLAPMRAMKPKSTMVMSAAPGGPPGPGSGDLPPGLAPAPGAQAGGSQARSRPRALALHARSWAESEAVACRLAVHLNQFLITSICVGTVCLCVTLPDVSF